MDVDGLADEDEDEEEARLGIEAARVRWRTLWTRAPPGMGAPEGSAAAASRPMLPDGTAGLCVETDEEAARVALIASNCEATGARIPPDVAVAAGGPRRTVRVVTTPFLDRICCDWSGSRVANRSWAARVMWATGGVLEGGDDGIWVVRPPGRGCGADARVVSGVASGTESTAEHAPTTDEPSAAASRRSAGTVAFDMLGWVPVASDAGTSSTDVEEEAEWRECGAGPWMRMEDDESSVFAFGLGPSKDERELQVDARTESQATQASKPPVIRIGGTIEVSQTSIAAAARLGITESEQKTRTVAPPLSDAPEPRMFVFPPSSATQRKGGRGGLQAEEWLSDAQATALRAYCDPGTPDVARHGGLPIVDAARIVAMPAATAGAVDDRADFEGHGQSPPRSNAGGTAQSTQNKQGSQALTVRSPG